MMKKLSMSAFCVFLPIMLLIYGISFKKYDIILNSLYTIMWLAVFMIFHKKTNFLTTKTYYCILVFILMSVFAGKSLGFYKLIPKWDKMLHFISGFIIVASGKQLYKKLEGNEKNKKLMNVFSLSVAFSMACLWEITEFFSDKLFGTVAQKNSLNDTMWDMLAGTSSALIALFFL